MNAEEYWARLTSDKRVAAAIQEIVAEHDARMVARRQQWARVAARMGWVSRLKGWRYWLRWSMLRLPWPWAMRVFSWAGRWRCQSVATFGKLPIPPCPECGKRALQLRSEYWWCSACGVGGDGRPPGP